MPQARCAHRNDVSQKWHALAERRLADLVALYNSGRWNRYFAAETFLHHMEKAVALSARWAEIAPPRIPEVKEQQRQAA
jgi:uncharacterized repeat protein (TIGR03809 family)